MVCDSFSQKARLSFCNRSQGNTLCVSVLTNSKKAREKYGHYLNKKFWGATEILAADLKAWILCY